MTTLSFSRLTGVMIVAGGAALLASLPFWASSLLPATAQTEPTPQAGVIAANASAPSDPPAQAAYAQDKTAFEAAVRAYLLDNPEVIVEALETFQERQRAEAEARARDAIATRQDDIERDGYSYVGGNPEGDVTLVEFVDYNCGFCKRVHADVQAVVADDPNLRYVVKEFPILAPSSITAARAVLASIQMADNAAYETLHDALMAHRGSLTDEQVRGYAEAAGLDWAALSDVMRSDQISDAIAETRSLAEALNISGTPAFIIGGELIPGAVPQSTLQEAVARARAAR